MCLNIPLRHIDAVSLSKYADGSGDLALTLAKGERVGYLLNWPHVRPLHFTKPQPALRGLRDVAIVASVLSKALQDSGAVATTPAAVAPSERKAQVAPSGTSSAVA